VTLHGRESPFYEVSFEVLEKQATCTYHKFEFVGILCAHILQIFLKKSLVDTIPQHYVLERWTINAKSRIIHGISSDDIQVETQNSSTLMRNSLMLQFYEVVEVGCQSKRKYEHLGIGLQKLHRELLIMDDGSDKDINDANEGSAEDLVLNNQVLSNLTFTLQDPLHVRCKGAPKSVRQKNPKEKQAMTKRTCSICKKTGHVRTNCPSHKQTRYSYTFFIYLQ
jgi:hypothetical protein